MVVFGIKNDGNHRQSATTVNSILCIRVTHALDTISFTFRYSLTLFFKMFKTTLLCIYTFYICFQTFVAQKLSKGHHRQTLCETSNNQPIARLLLKVFPMSIVFLRLRYKHDEARIGRKDTIDLFRSL